MVTGYIFWQKTLDHLGTFPMFYEIPCESLEHAMELFKLYNGVYKYRGIDFYSVTKNKRFHCAKVIIRSYV